MRLEQSEKTITLTSSGRLARLIGIAALAFGIGGGLLFLLAATKSIGVWVWLLMAAWLVAWGFIAGICLLYGLDIAAVFDLVQRTVSIERRGLTGTQTTKLLFGEIASVGLTRHQDEYGRSNYVLEVQGCDGALHMLSSLGNQPDANAIVQKIEAATGLSRKDRDASLTYAIEEIKKLFQRKR
jgi:hypothetical protein